LDILPVVLCIDAEPDPRELPSRAPAPCAGLDKLLTLEPALRDRLSAAADRAAEFTWCLRIDPQMAEAYGSSTWIVTEYEAAWSAFRDRGDNLGIHPHCWRWQDGWVADHADAEWVAHCSSIALDGFRQLFGEACKVHKHGDGFMTTAIARHLDDHGVLVDLSLEPGQIAHRNLMPSEDTTGWLPDTRPVPQFAYHPSRSDFRAPDPTRTDGLTMLPLSMGVTLALTEHRSRVVGAGTYTPLWLWRDPDQFRAMLAVRLGAPELTHIAFAVRSDTVLQEDLWTNVEANMAEVGRQLKGQHEWATAQRAATIALDRRRHLTAAGVELAPSADASARQWLRGRDDPGFRERVDVSALAFGPEHPLAGPTPPSPSLSVSAVLPVYGSAPHLRDAVASIVDQTAPPVELIVVDDGSTRDLDFLHGVAAPFPIRIARQENAGQSAARNAGARLARGDLIAFLDQDDMWHAEHLASLTRPFDTNADLVWSYSEFDEIDADGRTVTRSYLSQQGVAHPKLTLVDCIGADLMVLPSASVVRRDAFLELGGFDAGLQGFEDDDLYVRGFRAGWQFSFDGTALTRYRVHEDGDSAGPHFAASRRRYSEKLQRTVRDDRRAGRYYMRDVAAPRFFQAALDDYVRAVSAGEWTTADELLRDLQYLGRLRRDWPTLSWKVWLISRPKLFAAMLRLHDGLPRALRLTDNPAVRQR